jgi:hypothetical protein
MLLVTLLQLALATLCGTAFGTATSFGDAPDADRGLPPVATPVHASPDKKRWRWQSSAAAPAANWTQDVFGISNWVPPDVPSPRAGWARSTAGSQSMPPQTSR